MKKGIFLALEGGDASGKSTNAKFLTELLRERGYTVVLTREPGGTEVAEEIRSTLINKRLEVVHPLTEVLLFAASRHQHVENFIKPNLERGFVVISDRFTDSSYAYQAHGRGMMDEFSVVEKMVLKGFRPDHVLFFAASAEVSERRLADRRIASDRFEEENSAFKKNVLAGYAARVVQHPQTTHVIDANRDLDNVQLQLRFWADIHFPSLKDPHSLAALEASIAHIQARWEDEPTDIVLQGNPLSPSLLDKGDDTTIRAFDVIEDPSHFVVDENESLIGTAPNPLDFTSYFREAKRFGLIIHEFPTTTPQSIAEKIFQEVIGSFNGRTIRCEYGQPVRDNHASPEAYNSRLITISERRHCLTLVNFYLVKDLNTERFKFMATAVACGPFAGQVERCIDTLTTTARPLRYRGVRYPEEATYHEHARKQSRSSCAHFNQLKIITWDFCHLPEFDEEGRPNFKG